MLRGAVLPCRRTVSASDDADLLARRSRERSLRLHEAL